MSLFWYTHDGVVSNRVGGRTPILVGCGHRNCPSWLRAGVTSKSPEMRMTL